MSLKPVYETCRTCDGVGCGCPMCGDKGKILLGFVSSKVLRAWAAGLMYRDALDQAMDDEVCRRFDHQRDLKKDSRP